ncbi:MAG: hypothetical protein AAGA65_21155 [Actinomycetota bacterium]
MADRFDFGHYRRPALHRVRQNSRIQPVRPYWSRPKFLRITVVAVVLAALAGTAWLQRSDRQTIELDPSGPYRINSTTGPIEVTSGVDPVVLYDRSWLLRGPTATTDNGELQLRCDTRWPCRGTSTVVLPPRSGTPIALELSGDEDLLISAFDGDLSAEATADGSVILGPVGGRLVARTDRGSVQGYGLLASEVDVETAAGPVALDFRIRPSRVSVRSDAGEVTITLPPGEYAVTVVGGSSNAINVGQAADADSTITIHTRGPVRIDHST